MFYRSLCFLLTCTILLLNDGDISGRSGVGAIPNLNAKGREGYAPLSLSGDARQHYLISPYDAILREESHREGHDWRLLAAIAYNESRFTADIVSPRGARGLMQIMPAVASQYDIPAASLMDPRTNVRLAAQILTRIEDGLKFSKSVPAEDRTRIILASYNGGIGHVSDARKLAAKYGADPNRWADVSTYLRLKNDPVYVEDEVVKCGRFGGSGQTLAFVDKVMGKYSAYCRKATL